MRQIWRTLQFWAVLLFVGATLCIVLAFLLHNTGGQ